MLMDIFHYFLEQMINQIINNIICGMKDYENNR